MGPLQSLLNNKLEDRVKGIFYYVVGILSFTEKLQNEKNISRFLKNIDTIGSLYAEIQKQIATDIARTRQDPLRTWLPDIKG